MRALMIPALLLSGCGQDEPVSPRAEIKNEQVDPAAAWDLQSSDEGAALVVASGDGGAALRLFCPAGQRKLVVNVPAFRPIGSEERLSFGSGGEALALVADSRGDAQRGGVTGEGPVPANLAELFLGPVSASYGAQVSGPHGAPPAASVTAFAAACAGGRSSEGQEPAAPVATPPASGSPCLNQDGKPVPANAIRALGTEPFWAARVEGRCVTYSHPEDQSGTRVWTSFSGTAASGTWRGALNGRPFVMTTRPQEGCSDGMSDKRYPIAVLLRVGGEQRSGCAAPG